MSRQFFFSIPGSAPAWLFDAAQIFFVTGIAKDVRGATRPRVQVFVGWAPLSVKQSVR
jgi:hypothetical protein